MLCFAQTMRNYGSGEELKGNFSLLATQTVTKMEAVQNGEAMDLDHIPGQQFQIDPKQVRNKAGGFVFKVNDFDRLKRFLVLGSEGGTYYANGGELGIENLKVLVELIKDGKGKDAIEIIRDYSVNGRCPKQTTVVYCLAVCARYHDGIHSEKFIRTRREAYNILSDVCRIPTDLFQFVQYCEDISRGVNSKTGWGRAHRKAIQNWYLKKPGQKLAYLVTKYKQRNEWSHKDLLKLSHPKPGDDMKSHACVFKYITKGYEAAASFVNNPEKFPSIDQDLSATFGTLHAVNEAIKIGNTESTSFEEKEKEIVKLIEDHGLVREHIPSQLLKSLAVWFALLYKMPMTALIRNLGKMSSLGMFEDKDGHKGTEVAMQVAVWLRDEERLKNARIHPFNVLVALKTYQSGHGAKGSNTWNANKVIVEALNDTFYKSFKYVEPTNKRYLLGIDVSGSMTCGGCHGCKIINPREASAAMAMVALRTEPNAIPMAFCKKLVPLAINRDMYLEDVIKKADELMFGSTDCARPMLHALENKIPVDVFVVYTDNDTWCGDVHPFEALKQYRLEMNIPDAKLIVCGMNSSGFTIADPDDPGMLDIVGFDSSAPQIIAQFAMQNLN